MPTTGRVSVRVWCAWREAHPLSRRAFAAAVVTSLALAVLVSSPVVVRVSTAVVGFSLAIAALVDLHEQRLPNFVLGVAAASAVSSAVLTGRLDVVVGCLLGGLVAGGSMAIVRISRGVGMGDVKMAGAIGFGVGSLSLVAAPLAIACAATVAAVHGALTGRSRLALGPSLWLGWASAVAVVAGGWA
jgi:N-acetylglutamate synthase/N-acetylornithine aminotransferase